MINELNEAIAAYQTKWQTLVVSRNDKQFFEALEPTAVAWKVADLADFDTCCSSLRDVSDRVHLGWVNERWLATFHLKNVKLEQSISIVKLMQRRPGSTDPVGLDHIDFYSSQVAGAESVLAQESDLKWTHETNGDFCAWISLWFSGTEAKLRSNTTLDVCARELEAAQDKILKELE